MTNEEKLQAFKWAIDKLNPIMDKYGFYGTAIIYGDPEDHKIINVAFDFDKVADDPNKGMDMVDEIMYDLKSVELNVTDLYALSVPENKSLYSSLVSAVNFGVTFRP